MLTIYLVRHGQTEANLAKIKQGHADSPLTEKGVLDAENLGRKLKGIQFDYVYSSDLGRAFITAYIICQKLGFSFEIIRAKELRELNFGDYSYTNAKQLEEKGIFYERSVESVVPGGENYLQLQRRAVDFVKELEQKHNGKTILIVAHGGVVRCMLSFFNKWDLKDVLAMDVGHDFVGKFVIEYGAGKSYERISYER